MAETDFDDQLRQEALAKETGQGEDPDDLIQQGRTRVDPDGTVYEWDCDKSAWFPKIDEDFIAKYQMNYGAESSSTDTTTTNTATSAPGGEWVQPDPSQCYAYFKENYNTGDTSVDVPDVDSTEYRDWYNYYYCGDYGNQSQEVSQPSAKDPDQSENSKNIMAPPSDPTQDDYYAYYAEYYRQTENSGEQDTRPSGDGEVGQSASANPGTATDGNAAKPADKDDDKTEEQKGKRKHPDPPKWFEMEDDKNNNVYVSGMPTDITDDEYLELMNKCGLIMYDPITRKPKLKLYKDSNGVNKGDGLCCYIKNESVELALQILDGYNLRGETISVTLAQFTLKGNFDPSKRRRKLTNREKKKMKEKQEKLFDWRPDKPRGTRGRNERVIIIKNAFAPSDFDQDPTAINEIRNDLREECSKYGDIRKVMVYDRHPEGIASVTFKEAEDADVCKEAVNGRWFAQKQLSAETWDGRTKYHVEETDEERVERIRKWDAYLAGGGKKEDREKWEQDHDVQIRVQQRQKQLDNDKDSSNQGNKNNQTGDAKGSHVDKQSDREAGGQPVTDPQSGDAASPSHVVLSANDHEDSGIGADNGDHGDASHDQQAVPGDMEGVEHEESGASQPSVE